MRSAVSFFLCMLLTGGGIAQDYLFNMKDFGGIGDGKTICTIAFRKAVDACNKAGGGEVIIPSGILLQVPSSYR